MTPFQTSELWLALPEIYLTGAICLVLLFDLFFAVKQPGRTATFTLLVLLVGAVLTWRQGITDRSVIFQGMYVVDRLSSLLKLGAYLFAALALFYSREYLVRRGIQKGEFYVLALTALLGVLVLASAANLVTLYVGVELLSLSLYAIVYLIVFGAGIFYMVRLARAGPPEHVELREPKLGERPARPLSGAEADA